MEVLGRVASGWLRVDQRGTLVRVVGLEPGRNHLKDSEGRNRRLISERFFLSLGGMQIKSEAADEGEEEEKEVEKFGSCHSCNTVAESNSFA